MDCSNNPFVERHEQFVYYAGLCLRDLGDLWQTTQHAFGNAVQAYTQQYLDHKSEDEGIVRLHHFRRAFDYGAITLISCFYHLTSAAYHAVLRVNEPEDRYLTPYQILRGKFPPCRMGWLRPFLESIEKHASYRIISEYRHHFVHKGSPLIKGEVRQTRRDVYADPGIVRGAFGRFGGGRLIGPQEVHQYTVHQLVYHSARCNRFLVAKTLEFLDSRVAPEVKGKYNLPWP